MCGIIAVTSRRPAANMLVEGLSRLEYRGYDSAGVCIQGATGKHIISKKMGKVKELRNELTDPTLQEGCCGIAHTRWATHGVVSVENSHPHYSGSICIVHNGIVENYSEIREELISEGYIFLSETDTEVIAHLINKFSKSGSTLIESSLQAIKILEGSYALAILSEDEPNTVIGVRVGSPLVVGIGFEEGFLASDTLALSPFVSKCLYLDDGDIVHLNLGSFTIYNQNMEVVEREVVSLDHDSKGISKEGYSHFMEKELFEASSVAERLIRKFIPIDEFLIPSDLLYLKELSQSIQEIHIISCGGSMHAAAYGQIIFQQLLELPCHIYISSEYRYQPPVLKASKNALFISISQSGETADTIGALEVAKQLGYMSTISICNVKNSSLARQSDYVFNIEAGVEIGVSSTKALTNQMISMVLISLSFRQSCANDFVDDLLMLPKKLSIIHSLRREIQEIAEYIRTTSAVFFIGRGLDYSVAMEGALKLKEITYIFSESYPSGELKHGPLALMDENVTVIAISTDENLIQKTFSNLEESKSRGAKPFFFICDGLKTDAENVLKIPNIGKTLSPIIMCNVVQFLSYDTALLLGTDADQPRNLAKSVTVE